MTNCLMNATYTKMQERLLSDDNLKAFTVCCDTVKNEFFFIERIDSDAVITNNNKYKDYISLWDYQIEQLSNEGVEWIRRLLDRDNILIVTKCNRVLKFMEGNADKRHVREKRKGPRWD